MEKFKKWLLSFIFTPEEKLLISIAIRTRANHLIKHKNEKSKFGSLELHERVKIYKKIENLFVNKYEKTF